MTSTIVFAHTPTIPSGPVTVSTTITAKDKARITAAAKKAKVTQSEWLRQAIAARL